LNTSRVLFTNVHAPHLRRMDFFVFIIIVALAWALTQILRTQ